MHIDLETHLAELSSLALAESASPDCMAGWAELSSPEGGKIKFPLSSMSTILKVAAGLLTGVEVDLGGISSSPCAWSVSMFDSFSSFSVSSPVTASSSEERACTLTLKLPPLFSSFLSSESDPEPASANGSSSVSVSSLGVASELMAADAAEGLRALESEDVVG